MTVNDKIIKNKLGLLNLAQELGNVSKACQMMGFSRDTFYRYKSAVEEGGVENLLDQSRRKPNLKNRIEPILEERIDKKAVDNPSLGQQIFSGKRSTMPVLPLRTANPNSVTPFKRDG